MNLQWLVSLISWSPEHVFAMCAAAAFVSQAHLPVTVSAVREGGRIACSEALWSLRWSAALESDSRCRFRRAGDNSARCVIQLSLRTIGRRCSCKATYKRTVSTKLHQFITKTNVFAAENRTQVQLQSNVQEDRFISKVSSIHHKSFINSSQKQI